MTKTLHDLIHTLEPMSPVIDGLKLAQVVKDDVLTGPFLNLAGQREHQALMATGLEALAAAGLPTQDVRNLAKSLLSENGHYGAFCEIGTYAWMARNGIFFAPQVSLGPKQVLNPNGCIIDGEFTSARTYFDIKAMGFTEYTRELFVKKVEGALPGKVVTISGPSDVAVKDIETHALRRFRSIADDLAKGPADIAELHWRLAAHTRAGVTSSVLETNPYRAAAANRHYPFKTARQFTRRRPFVLIFAWASPFNRELHYNFADGAEVMLRSLARRVFLQSARETRVDVSQFDPGVPPGTSVAKASKLISAMLFIGLDTDQAYFFQNPRATHPLTRLRFSEIFDFAPPPGMLVDDFADDDY